MAIRRPCRCWLRLSNALAMKTSSPFSRSIICRLSVSFLSSARFLGGLLVQFLFLCVTLAQCSTLFLGLVTFLPHFLFSFRLLLRFAKRPSMMSALCSPALDVKEGDIVTVGQCLPLAGTVRFNVLKVQKHKILGSAWKQFVLC